MRRVRNLGISRSPKETRARKSAVPQRNSGGATGARRPGNGTDEPDDAAAPTAVPRRLVERRERIEDAALRRFVQAPVEQVAMSDIARDARCSLQTIYNDYGDKDGLLRRCLARWDARFMGRIVKSLQSDVPYREQERRAIWQSRD